MTNLIYPKKFVGLHAHSTAGSIGDAIGTPAEHINFAIENGMDALALTDHGNMNGMAPQLYAWEALKKKGVNFQAIPGVEAYFIPSLAEWSALYQEDKRQKAQEKAAAQAKKKKTEEEEFEEIGDELADTKEEIDAAIKEDNEGTTTMENEAESKELKYFNPLNRRNHLVLLPKNKEGLKALFRLVSESYINGLYRFPRMDFDMLKKYCRGNVIALTACVAGTPASVVMKHQVKDFKQGFDPSALQDNFDVIQSELAQLVDQFQDALGPENFYLELQFNKLNIQHITNYHLIECSKRTGAPLVVTCDSHYSRPEHWRDREIYKAMTWATKTGNFSVDQIPQKVDELKCELYPKNASQVWDTYLSLKDQFGFYDDQTVCDAIERSYTIAHEQIDKNVIDIDRSVKLPRLEKVASPKEIRDIDDKIRKKKGKEASVDGEELAYQILKQHAIDGLIIRGLQENQEYVQRLALELDTIRHLKLAKYFLTYEKIMELVSEKMLTGMGRGSAVGSLLAYVLNITQLDPIKHGLLFERFLSKKKFGMADIDSDCANRDLALELITQYFGQENVVAISNFAQLQMRSLIRDLARLYGVPHEEVGRYTLATEQEARAVAKKREDYDGTTWVLTYEEAKENSPTFNEFIDKYPQIEESIKVLFKQLRSTSRHAGGVLITDNAYTNLPVIVSGGVVQTPWAEGLNARHLEPLGLLKFDVLGLGTLRMIEETIKKIIQSKTGKRKVTFEEVKDWYYNNLHPDNNEMNDDTVYKHVYHEGNWGGVFQFAQPPVRSFAKKMKPESIADLSAVTSIFRPGPLNAGVDKLFLENRKHPNRIQYKHPLLKEILAEEAGCILGDQLVDTTLGKASIAEVVELHGMRYPVQVLTMNEETRKVEPEYVVAAQLTGYKPTITLEFDDGTEITLTEDHIVYTTNGQKPAGELTADDEIIGVEPSVHNESISSPT